MFPGASFFPMFRLGRDIHGGTPTDRPGPRDPVREGPVQSRRPGGPPGAGPARPGRRGIGDPGGRALAAVKRGLQAGLRGRERTVVLFSDATILTETPPLRACWSPVGEQAEVPVTGNRDKKVVFGALNPATGTLWLDEAAKWNQHTFQEHLRNIRAVWRGGGGRPVPGPGGPPTAQGTPAGR